MSGHGSIGAGGDRPVRALSERGEAMVGGLRLVYQRWPGPAGGHRCPPVLLLHGLLQRGAGMANLAAHLARHGPVVVPDLRGRGDSDQPPDGYDPATMAGDVAGLIEQLGLDRPVVIGRLHGGLVGYHLAARRPGLVRGLVLGDTAPEVSPARAEAARAVVRALPRRFDSLEAALAFYQGVLGLSAARARHDIPSDLVADGAGGYRWRHNLEVIERIEAAAMPRADWETLAEVTAPVLLLRGQRGEVPPPMAERFRQTVADCRVQTIYGARHDVFLGPGAEQAFGAIDLFLMRLDEGGSPAAPSGQLPIPAAGAASGAAAAADQVPLPGAEPPPAPAASAEGAVVIERIVRAINARDDAAVAALFAPDGRIEQYRPGGKAREGGLAEARAAFWEIFVGLPTGVVAARDVVANAAGDRVAAVLTLRAATGEGSEEAIVAPIFLRLRDGRIVEFVSYGLRLPASEA